MKGEALITIKGKDGKIKQQVKESNIVFDLPKELMKSVIKNMDLGIASGLSDNNGSSLLSASQNANIDAASNFDTWFKAIAVNDEACSEQDYKDWKLPVLYGGEQPTQDSNNKRYAQYDTANSAMTGNILKKSYTWNDCPAFTLRSINLKHLNNCNARATEPYWGAYPIKKYGKFYFFIGGYNNYQYQFKGMQPNRLCEKDGFEWATNNSGVKFKGLKCSGFSTSGSSSVYQPAIYACKDREIMVLRRTDDMTTDNTGSGEYKYLYVIDADTGVTKRRFTLSQFAGITPYSPYHPSLSTAKIIATEYGNFLLAQKKYSESPYVVALWRIPDQSEYSNYENGETISVWQDNFITNWSGWYLYVTAINNYILFSGSGSHRKVVKINSATPGDLTTISGYIPFNIASNYSRDYNYAPIVAFNKYGDETLMRTYYGIETWYNTTALNLSEGVEVAAGDTLTIEYTITAN